MSTVSCFHLSFISQTLMIVSISQTLMIVSKRDNITKDNLVNLIMCFNKIRKFRRKALILSILLIFMVKILKNLLCPSVISLAEFHKCPVCYGESACHHVFDGKIKIEPFDFHSSLSHIFSSKNVFFGEFNNKKIVVKKLAHDQEFVMFDDMICRDSPNYCTDKNYKDEIINSSNYFSRILDDVSLNFINDDRSGLILCPNSTKMKFFNKLKKVSSDNLNDLNLWMLIRLNPEPLILQILRAEEGWPVPKYYGTCGRIIIEEYIGLPLTAYYYSPWLLRAKIAVELLEAVKMLTFHDPEFSYYLTDMSPDNIAIDSAFKPIFIDLENLIVVNKNISLRDNSHELKTLHKTEEITECKNCFAFSPLDICSHPISDHNYYAVCNHILSAETSTATIPGGFLHDVPKDISSRYPDLKIMLAQCSVPSDYQTRIEIANKLVELLSKIYNSFDIIDLTVTNAEK